MSSPIVADQTDVIAFLADPASHGLETPVTCIHTHGAVVFLAGEHAYKLKRAVLFPFMDFSTLEKRRRACAAEIEINGPNAPMVYRRALPIVRRNDGLHIGRPGEIVDWVVWMRRFDPSATLDHVAEAAGLTPALLAKLAKVILASHRGAPLRDGRMAAAALSSYLDQNDAAFRAEPGLFDPEQVAALTSQSRECLADCRDLLYARGDAGLVRRCHGDLHLRNLVLIDGEPVLFDAIEFDDGIATCDVLYDLAFLLMDLWERDLRREANAILNRYLWSSEDERNLDGLAALPLFLSIRAALRAKIAAAEVSLVAESDRVGMVGEAQRYFDFALGFLQPARGRLVAIGGLSGTGKSTLAAALAPGLGRPLGAVLLRSDIERKHLCGVEETQRLPQDAYTAEVGGQVYDCLVRKARRGLEAGCSVILDAVHAGIHERDQIEALARDLGVPFTGLWLEAPIETLGQRVSARQADASDADASVVRRQSTYELGPMSWRRIDATGTADEVLRLAEATLR